MNLRKPTLKLSTLSNGEFGCCNYVNVCDGGGKCPHVTDFDDHEYASFCSVFKRYVSSKEQEHSLFFEEEIWVRIPRKNTVKSMICLFGSLIKKTTDFNSNYSIKDLKAKDDLLLLLVSSEKLTVKHNFTPGEEMDWNLSISFPKVLSISDLHTLFRLIIQKLHTYQIGIEGWIDVTKFELSDYAFRFTLEPSTQKTKVTEIADSTEEPMVNHLLLIDGSSLLTRTFHSTSKTAHLKTSTGIYTNAVLPMVRMFLQLMARFKPSHVAIGWDAGRNTWRRKEYADYKATRSETDPILKEQFKTAQDLFKAIGIFQYVDPDYEADDVIGTLRTRWLHEMDGMVSIISGDKDMLQLLDKRVSLYTPKQGVLEMDCYSFDYLNEFGFDSANQFLEVKGILGDSSDNLPGVKGVGKTKGYPFIQQFKTLEGIYNHLDQIASDSKLKKAAELLQLHKKDAFLSRRLATIVTNMPGVNSVSWTSIQKNINVREMAECFKRLEFNQLLKEIKDGKYRAS